MNRDVWDPAAAGESVLDFTRTRGLPEATFADLACAYGKLRSKVGGMLPMTLK